MKKYIVNTAFLSLALYGVVFDSMAMDRRKMDVEDKHSRIIYQDNVPVTRSMTKTTTPSQRLATTQSQVSTKQPKLEQQSNLTLKLPYEQPKLIAKSVTEQKNKSTYVKTSSRWATNREVINPAYTYHYYAPQDHLQSASLYPTEWFNMQQSYSQYGFPSVAFNSKLEVQVKKEARLLEVEKEKLPSVFVPSVQEIVVEEPKKTIVEEIVIEEPKKTVVEEIVIEEPESLVVNEGPTEIVLKDELSKMPRWEEICVRNDQEEKSSFANDVFLNLVLEHRNTLQKVDLRNTDVTRVVFVHIKYLNHLNSLDARDTVMLNQREQQLYDEGYIKFIKNIFKNNPHNSEAVKNIIASSYFL